MMQSLPGSRGNDCGADTSPVPTMLLSTAIRTSCLVVNMDYSQGECEVRSGQWRTWNLLRIGEFILFDHMG